MAASKPNVHDIFNVAIECPSDADRARYLDEACRDTPQIRCRVETLIRAHHEAGNFLEGTSPTIATPPMEAPGNIEQPGITIGRYELVHEIGRGGMGVVYMAAQSQPIKREVALKIIKPGMDTREVVARFEAERQALALMDHQCIAHVLDGGSTETGRPYFVMELVDGVPITDYCDESRYTTRQRLELFVQVCQAVQHAHQKGVIHRDLKPSNIMVTTTDETAVPKVIDFGIAKAVHQPLTEQSLHTQATQIVGTPLYMSPEQAQQGGQDIDTRTDVYSLGVVLYELLTGTTPFDKQRLDRSGLDEVKRIIREEEPPRPSNRLSTAGTALETIAARHHCDPKTLARELGGELDWMVMRALEKDRSRRYESASELSKDIGRYLDDEPVEACPPSRVYRLRKFARRYKAALGTVVLVSAALVIGMAVSLWQANVAREAERLAEQQRHESEANFQLAMQAMDELYLESIGEKRLLREDEIDFPGSNQSAEPVAAFSEFERELLERGLNFYDQFAQQNQGNPQAVFETGKAFYRVALLQVGLEENDDAGQAFGEAISRLKLLTEQHPTESKYFLELGKAYYGQARLSRWWPSVTDTYTEAKEALDRAIELQPDSSEALKLRGDIHKLLNENSRAALADYQMAVQLEPEDAELHSRLARLFNWRRFNLRDPAAALSHAKQAVKLEPQNWNNCQLLANIYTHQFADKESAIAVWEQWIPLSDSPSKTAEAQTIISEIAENHQETIQYVDRYMETLGAQEPGATAAWLYLRRGKANASLGKTAEAISDLKRALELDVITKGVFYGRLAEALRQLGAVDLALAACDKAETIQPEDVGIYELRGALYRDAGRYRESLAEFTKEIALVPRRSFQYKYRGQVYFKLGRYKEALADLQKALELHPNDPSCVYWVNPSLVAKCPDKTFRDGVFKLADRAIEITDDLPYAYGARGVLYAGSGKTTAALDDFAKSIELDPQHFFWYEWQYWFALIQLSEGNLDAYRQACADMLRQFRESKDKDVIYAAWVCSLGPDAVKDLSLPVHFANTSLESNPQSIVSLIALGAVLHRSGRSDEAVKRLMEALELIKDGKRRATERRAGIAYFLAMAHHQLGQDMEAAQWLGEANEQTEKAIANEPVAYNWFHGPITLQILRREAEALLKQAEHNETEPTDKPEEKAR